MSQNSVTIAGNVCNDLVLRRTNGGAAVTDFRVAVNQRAQVNGEWQTTDTTYTTVQVWDQLATNTAASLSKGDPVVVTGTLRSETWDGGDGVRRSKVFVKATAVGPDLTRSSVSVHRFAADPTPEERSNAAVGDADPRTSEAWEDTPRADDEADELGDEVPADASELDREPVGALG